ncbi:MAG: hypothetical protein COC24_000055, partial [Alphaproteobacteria bacterium]|nr:hypothetical protein [Alphaproteobacteria bacterium]
VGGMKSQLGALIAQCEIGGRVDGGGGVSSDRMPYDAMRVGFAVQGLSKDMQAIVVSNARAGQGQYRPVLKTIPCDSKEAKIEVAAGEVLAGVSRKWVKKDGVRKQVRCYPYCRITSTLTTKDMRYFIPQYKLWVKAVKLCTAQLSDLEGFKLIVPVLPEFWD